MKVTIHICRMELAHLVCIEVRVCLFKIVPLYHSTQNRLQKQFSPYTFHSTASESLWKVLHGSFFAQESATLERPVQCI